ncbi:hypothetical protein Godav_003789, partial [Gossypium davidsonii]|nr:hypothetical protein [Gossypium davidsonii]
MLSLPPFLPPPTQFYLAMVRPASTSFKMKSGETLIIPKFFLLIADIGVMSGAVLYIKDDLQISSTQQQILVGSLNVFSLIGSLASGKTSDTIGCRYTIVLAAVTFFVGAFLMGLAPSFPFLMAGRLVAGIGVFYSFMIGYISNFALSGLPQPLNWRLMLGLAALPVGAVALGVIAMPESPRWL